VESAKQGELKCRHEFSLASNGFVVVLSYPRRRPGVSIPYYLKEYPLQLERYAITRIRSIVSSFQDSDSISQLAYLLSLWRDTADGPWRAALRQVGSPERIGFPDLEELALFLLRLNDRPRLPADFVENTNSRTTPAPDSGAG
jgi:hypothetical protein